LACAASLAVLDVIEKENLLENIRIQGAYLGRKIQLDFILFMISSERLLLHGLTGNARAAPFVFDIRGGGGFWAIEFDFSTSQADFKGAAFALLVEARAMLNGMIVMGMTPAHLESDSDGEKGGHIILSPAFNITKEEVETIAKLLILTVEEVLDNYNVH